MFTQKNEIREQLYYCKAVNKAIYLQKHYTVITYGEGTKEHLQKTGCSNLQDCIDKKIRCPLKIFQL